MKNFSEMNRQEIIDELRYYIAQFENVERDAKDAGMSADEVFAILKKNLIADLTK
jgi:hypothetical protein